MLRTMIDGSSPTGQLSSTKQTATSWAVYGHEWAVQWLQRTVQTRDAQGATRGLRHAYLFVGPGQVGKSTLVRAFARGLLCTGVGQRPCGECRSCQLMERGSHPDFHLVQPTLTDGTVDRVDGLLRAEHAATVIHESLLRPVEGRYKIFLIQEAHLAGDTFFNKLLKTLEEPPDYVVLCLTAVDRAEVLPTIVSRCQVVELRPLSVETVRCALEERWKQPPEEAELLARLSNGRGWAVRQIAEKDGRSQRADQLAFLEQVLAADRIERLALAEKLAGSRDNRQLFGMLELWTGWWRDVLLLQSGCPEACMNVDKQAELEFLAQQVPSEEVREYLHTLRRIEEYLHHTINSRLALDVLLLRMPRARRVAA
jgi:DNA polymerase-3 subunit delta'